MSDQPLHALLAVYPDRSYADAALTYLQQMEKSHVLGFEGLAVVTKDIDGTVHGEVAGGPSGKRGAKRGALAGVALGLIFPAGVIGATVLGTGIGGLTGHLRGRTAPHEGLRELGERMERGRVGVLVLVHDAGVDDVANRLTGCEALHRLRIDANTLAIVDNAS